MKVEKETIYILNLTSKEACWLRTMVANAVATNLGEESYEHKKMRENFWNALNDQLLGEKE